MSTAEMDTTGASMWDCTNDEYHADPRVSSTMLKLLRKSPAKFHWRYVLGRDRPETTPAQALGSAVHSLVYEADKFDALFAVAPKVDRRTTAGKAAWAEFVAENDGKTLLPADVFGAAQHIANAVRSDVFAKMLLGLDGVAEQAIVWRDSATGIECKAKPDWACGKAATLVDLKTCGDASLAGFSRQMAAMEYHCQAAWYCDAWKALTGVQPAFVFIAVETEPPYEVSCHEITEEAMVLGRERNAQALQELSECRASGCYEPKWRQQINTLSLPAWAFRHDYELSTD